MGCPRDIFKRTATDFRNYFRALPTVSVGEHLAPYEGRRARRMILPVVVRGSSSRKVTWWGV